MSAESRRRHMVAAIGRRGAADDRVLDAMGRVPRERFVPQRLARRAYEDGALPIGLDQTISQPTMVAIMCSLLGVGPGDRVLDVGTGSGYAAAVLAAMGCEVVGIELRPELADRAAATLSALGLEVEVRTGDGAAERPIARRSRGSRSPLPPLPSHERSSASWPRAAAS
jgi:protein-L-isoaspartate(D-aspartate) O-methyltransferase